MSEDFEGKLIALEGPDGCGKSTQASLLSEWLELEGYEAEITREPTQNPLGQVLRDSLRGKIDLPIEAEALLFAGDRALHVSDVIRPSLKEGKIVITERYIYSSLAYQASRGLSQEWVENINEPAIDPDLSIFIDVPPEIGSERISSSRGSDIFDQDLKLQRKVREAYKKLARKRNMPLIDGTLSKEKVQKRIRDEVKRILHADLSREG